jgi:hemin uptake protein HemP
MTATQPSSTTAPQTESNAIDRERGPERVVDSQDLLQGARSVTIQHNGATYRLQATKLGKLILTK